jgi:hypothetical protein
MDGNWFATFTSARSCSYSGHAQPEGRLRAIASFLMQSARSNRSRIQRHYSRPSTLFGARFMNRIFSKALDAETGKWHRQVGDIMVRKLSPRRSGLNAGGRVPRPRSECSHRIIPNVVPGNDLGKSHRVSVYKGKYRDLTFATPVSAIVAQLGNRGQIDAGYIGWSGSHCLVGPI